MAMDLSPHLKTFFEESYEALDLMESGLVRLSPDDLDPDLVHGIFRAAHSLKGNSATFGFTHLSELTHLMENLLERVRDGRLAPTSEMVDLLLATLDCLRSLLGMAREGENRDDPCSEELAEGLRVYLEGGGDGTDSGQSAGEPTIQEGGGGWLVHFSPHSGMLRTGNDPLRLVKELSELGEASAAPDASGLPGLDEMDPETAYLTWQVSVPGEASRDEVEEVFEWVEDECDLTVSPLQADGEPSRDREEPAAPPEAEQGPDGQGEAPARPAQPRSGAAGGGAKQAGGEAESIRVGLDKVDSLINKVGELVIVQAMLADIGEDLSDGRMEELRDGLNQLKRHTRELQESVMQIRMMPIRSVFQRLPRIVRDLTRKMDKSVELELRGEDTELDKTVLEQLSDPLTHLLRNAVDHGIESSAARRAAGKPETGHVCVEAYHQGGNIYVEVRDDGGGLDREKLLAKGRALGLIGEEEIPPDEKINAMIFQPGFSTSGEVSDVSGRGVGMDVVLKNIQALNGRVEVHSEPGEGTSTIIRLPLTLAILDGQLAAAGGQTFVIPMLSIQESIQVEQERIQSLGGRQQIYQLREEYIPLVRLHDVFNLPGEPPALADGLLVVMESGDGRRVGLFVDELLGQQEVVIKSLENNFRKVTGISGGTILGNGQVALILDVAGIEELAGIGSGREAA